VVTPERDVILEERRMRTESDPSEQLSEAMQAALFTQHPYGRPIIGFAHEIESLSRTDALAYYDRFYSPGNAILVVAGDVRPEEVIEIAEKKFGSIPSRGQQLPRFRPREPVPRAHRRVTLADEKVEQPLYQSIFLVPSYMSASPGDAEALEVLAYLLGGGHTSLLFKTLVMERKLAVLAGAHYQGTAVDDTRFYVYAVPSPGVNLEAIEAAIGEVIAGVAAHGVDEADLRRAKTRLVAETIFAQDNQAALARWYGASLAAGLGLVDIAEWPQRIEEVTADEVKRSAHWLDQRRGVTGFLLPAETASSETDPQAAVQPVS
jgi:zinc protease